MTTEHKYVSKVTMSSNVFPGVRFTLLKASHARENDLRARLLRFQGDSISTLQDALTLSEEAATMPIDELNRKLDQQVGRAQVTNADVDAEMVRWALVDVLGLTIDDRPATPETLISEGPTELFMEVRDLVYGLLSSPHKIDQPAPNVTFSTGGLIQ